MRQKAHKSKVFREEVEVAANRTREITIKTLLENKEQYFRWKAEVDKAMNLPENAKAMTKLQKAHPGIDSEERRLYRTANLLSNMPNPKDYGFRDSNAAVFSHTAGYNRHYARAKHYSELPHNDTGAYLQLGWGPNRMDIAPRAKKMPPGHYVMRVRAGVVEGSPPYRHFIEVGHPQRENNVARGFAGFTISSHHVTGSIENPSVIEIPLEVGIDTPRAFAIQERQPTGRKADIDWYNEIKRENGYGIPPAIWVDWMELAGPLPATGPSPALEQAMRTHQAVASQTDRARKILTDFTVDALRGVAPDPKFIDKLVAIFDARQKEGEAFDLAIRTPLSVVLASPGFLYLNEPRDEGRPRRLNDRELAVRLAYFLWSAPPDETLFELARQKELSKPKVLRGQVDRMITDPRSQAFVAGFVHQWLDMERLDFFQFDAGLHREFYENTRAAAREEVYQSFAHLLRDPEGGQLSKLLKSDYVMINGLLGTYYGLEGVEGDAFRKVPLPAGSPRGGLLGMAAIHAMGSDGIESSPVERGAWVLRHVLHDPPPPAPPNVPQLSRLADKPLSTRERLTAHQEEPQCASCHRKIDPIGFGMENFDAAGKWRDIERIVTTSRKGKRSYWNQGAHEIDASGQLHRGAAFANFAELREVVKAHKDDFAQGFTEHLIEYGLGRRFAFTDQDLAGEIIAAAKDEDFTVSAFLQALVRSSAFREK